MSVAPLMVAVHARLPLALVTVQPVEPLPPPSRMSPVDVPPIDTVPLPLASTVRLPLPVEIALAPTFRELTAVALKVPPVIVPPDTLPPENVPPDSVPPLIVAPLIVPVTVNVPPIEALLVTLRPVPAPPTVTVPLKVLLPPNVWVPAVTRPTWVASAD